MQCGKLRRHLAGGRALQTVRRRRWSERVFAGWIELGFALTANGWAAASSRMAANLWISAARRIAARRAAQLRSHCGEAGGVGE